MLTVNALACSDKIIIPVHANYLSIKGMEQLFSTITEIKSQINENLDIAGILITMVDNRTNYSKDIINYIRNNYANKINVFNTIIPMSVKAGEMCIEGKSIYEYDPKGKATEAYENVVNEVLQVLNGDVI